MDYSGLFFFVIFSVHLSVHPLVCADNTCSPALPCNKTGPMVRFPFWRKGNQPDSCGYSGFMLSCNNKNETILNLIFSGEFVVKNIDYTTHTILINDPNSCLPKRMENFTLSGSPFSYLYARNLKFFNCSSNLTYYMSSTWYRPIPIPCLSDINYTVYAVPARVADRGMPSSCVDVNSNESVSSAWSTSEYWTSMNPQGDLELRWRDPRCWSCVEQGQSCLIIDNNQVVCASPSKESKKSLPRSAKYGIIIGIGIPALLLIIGLGCHVCSRVRAYSIQRRLVTELSSNITPQPAVTATGLDGKTIESLPKTVLGASRRLPKPSDSTCPICLCEYQPTETLRTIPDCNHYFHSDCIDEWLKLNGSCPLCRTESLSMTPCSSMSSSTTTTTISS